MGEKGATDKDGLICNCAISSTREEVVINQQVDSQTRNWKMPGEVERPAATSVLKRSKSTKKKRSAAGAVHPDRISPLKRQLEEAQTWTKDEMGSFLALDTLRERVKFVYSLLPFDATGLDRLWPIQIVQVGFELKSISMYINILTCMNATNSIFSRAEGFEDQAEAVREGQGAVRERGMGAGAAPLQRGLSLQLGKGCVTDGDRSANKGPLNRGKNFQQIQLVNLLFQWTFVHVAYLLYLQCDTTLVNLHCNASLDQTEAVCTTVKRT